MPPAQRAGSQGHPGRRAGTCPFCQIVRGESPAARVFEDEVVLAFLDTRPLLPGHCLLVPKTHFASLDELPGALVGPLFTAVQRLAIAVERGMDADGSFVAINTRVSQSVTHLHIHVVPRWRGDGLFTHGFMWRRHPYADDDAGARIQAALRADHR